MTRNVGIKQASQYLIKALTIFSGGIPRGTFQEPTQNITSDSSKFGIDIRGIFQELNIYDNLFFPCVTGTIVIQDGVGLMRKVRFDGSEFIFIHMAKYADTDASIELEIKGTYLINKVTDRVNIGMNSEVYTLHFISQEFLLSEQQKIRKSYTGKYSEIISSILSQHLNVQVNDTVDNVVKNRIEESKGLDKIIIPNLTPFQAIDFLASRALNEKDVPDFVFWQDHLFGYNFNSLSKMLAKDPDFEINFGTKNLAINESIGNKQYYKSTLLGANDFKVVSNFDLMKNIKNGYYVGKFLAFDPLTRKFDFKTITHNDVYGKVSPGRPPTSTPNNSDVPSHANKYPFNTQIYNKKAKLATEMLESKITVYPFEISRRDSEYVNKFEPGSGNYFDNTHNYVLQRKAIFYNLMQRVVKVTMPGNFRFLSGRNVFLNIPHFYNERKESGEEGDKSLSGKYIITAVRHIIRQDKHETILEVATDSSQLDPITGRP